jgi:ABC-type antimicrobial peptide transport system permease subunit
MSSFGIVIGIALFVFFISLGFGVQKVVGELLGALPVNQLEVVPKTYSLGVLRMGQGATINDATIDQFRTLPHVKTVFGKMNVKVPAFAQIPIPRMLQKRGMARSFGTELVMQGISPDAISPDNFAYKDFRDLPKKPIKSFKDIKEPIPVLLSPRLIQIFNAVLSDLRGVPKINDKLVRIVHFDLRLGASVFRSRFHPKGEKRLKCRVVGVSSRAILVGITIPLRYARFFNEFYNGKKKASGYQSAIIETKQADHTPAVLKRVTGMGFTLERGQKIARKMGEVTLLIVLLLSLISIVIMISAAISISHVFFMSVFERRYQIGLMRAVGATKGTIFRLVMMEAGVVGIVSGLLGVGLFWGATRIAQNALASWKGLPFPPEQLFAFPLWLPFVAIGFAIFFCLLGSFFPAQRAASLDPIEVLSDG